MGYRLSDMVHLEVGEGQALDYWVGRKELTAKPADPSGAPEKRGS
jgi:hypothetical protein